MFFALLFALAAQAQVQFPVEKYQLKNGLTVLLAEDHSVPAVNYQTWFRVGSRDEKKGKTGVAHLFEHMMFKETKKHPDGEYDRLLQSNGGSFNAFTTRDFTGYFINAPSAKLDLLMDLESDRMVNLQVSAKNLKSEIEVVKEERRMRVDNSADGALSEAVFQNAFQVHPYGVPVIGWMDDITNLSLKDCQDFYRTYYAPNNAILTIVGDIDIERTKKLIEKYYGGLSSQPIPARENFTEPPQKVIRSAVINKEVQGELLSMVYKIPGAGQDDTYALDLFAGVLGQGNASRLFRTLVYEKQLATNVTVEAYTPKDVGLFYVEITLKPGVNAKQVQAAVLTELARARSQKISPKELAKAKNQALVNQVNSLKTISGKGKGLIINEIYFNDFSRLFKDLEKYDAITSEQIQKVAQTYLRPEQVTVVVAKAKGKGRI